MNSEILSPELSSRVMRLLGRLMDDGMTLTRDTEAAAALSECGWVVGLALEVESPSIVWRVRAPARALADARALLDEVSA